MPVVPAADPESAGGDPAPASLRWRHPLLLAGMSAVLSGAGQWAVGLRRRAWIFLGPLAVAALLTVIAARRGVDYVFDLFVRPGFLWWLLAANLVLLVVRLASVFDAYRLGNWRESSRWSRGLLVGLALVVGLPHAVVASYSLDAIDVLDTVFVGDDVPDLAEREAALLASGVSEEDLGPLLSIAPGTSAPGTSPPVSVPAQPSTPTTQFVVSTRVPFLDVNDAGARDLEFFDTELLGGEELTEGRITILLAGGDAGPGRSGMRTDTMIVATLDIGTGRASLIAVPRNLSRVPLPPEFDEVFVDLEIAYAEREAEETATTTTTTITTTTTTPPTTTTTTTTPTTTTTTPTTTTPTTTTPTTTTPTTTTPTTTSATPTTTTAGPPTTTTTTTVPPTTNTAPPPPFESCKCYVDMLNSLHPRTRNWVRTFPEAVDPGMEALRRTISHLLDLRIDYYVLVDMAGFVALVDALGGVDVYFDAPMHIAFSAAEEGGEKALIDVEVGLNRLTGLQALAYSRNRYRSSDYVRMKRQRCMLRSVAAEADFFTLVRSFSALAAAVSDNARTNIPLELLPDLFRIVTRLDSAEITTQAFTPGYYAPTRDFLRRPVPDVDRIRAKVRSMLANGGEGSGGADDDSECD